MALKRYFIPARMRNGGAPYVQDMTYTSGQSFKKGALLTLAAAGTIEECAADPTAIWGVAGTMPGFGPGRNLADDNLVVVRTNVEDKVSVIRAQRGVEFSGRAVNGGTDPVTPALTNIGESYGVVKTSDGSWAIDMAETTTKSVEITDIDIDTKTFIFVFLEAALQAPL